MLELEFMPDSTAMVIWQRPAFMMGKDPTQGLFQSRERSWTKPPSCEPAGKLPHLNVKHTVIDMVQPYVLV